MMIYRRRIRGGLVERLEIVAVHGDSNVTGVDEPFEGDALTIVDVEKCEEALIYYVKMPSHLRIRPPDWRDLAYDHAEVQRRIVVCVTDNCQSFMAEPIEDHSLRQIEKTLSLVLKDLSAIMDVKSVTCKSQEIPGRYVVCVQFEHKNGVSQNLAIAIDNEGF